MRKDQVIKTVKDAAKKAGLEFSEVELTRHTGIIVGDFRSTLSRSSGEVDETTAKKFFKQYEHVLGEGWWK